MEKESKIIEPSICLPKDKELLETTEAVTVKFGAGQISLGTIYKRFQWFIWKNLDQDLGTCSIHQIYYWLKWDECEYIKHPKV